MDSGKILKIIPTLFETMEYGTVNEKVGAAQAWINKINRLRPEHFEEVETIGQYRTERIQIPVYGPVNNLIKTVPSATLWSKTDKYDKAKVLHKLSDEIGEKSNLFEEIEVLLRGILSKETRSKVVPFMVDSFKYYSTFATQVDANHTPKGYVLISITNESSLELFSLALAPALAAGYSVIIQASPRISVAILLLIELCVSSGIPENTLTLISEKESLWGHKNIEVCVQFGKKYDKTTALPINTKFLSVCKGEKIPFIVFNNADLDSACESLVEAVWGYQGMLPWSVDSVLVQEDIFQIFVDKLTQTMSRITMGYAMDKMVDFSYPINRTATATLNRYVEEAKLRSIEVYPNRSVLNQFEPTLFVGGNCIEHNAFLENDNIPCLTATAFRTTSEVIGLANNNCQGLAASLWTENNSLGVGVAKKLNVSTIWINGYGYFTPSSSIYPKKHSGTGCFGGEQGFWQYVNNIPKNVAADEKTSVDGLSSTSNLDSTIKSAKIGFDNWNKITLDGRIKKFKTIAEKLNGVEMELWTKAIYAAIINSYSSANNSSTPSMQLNVLDDAVGVLLFDCQNLNDSLIVTNILNALLKGNSVIVRTKVLDQINVTLGDILSKNIPSGAFNILKNDESNSLNIDSNGIQGYFNYLHNNNGTKSAIVLNSIASKSKSIWSKLD